MEYYNDIVQRYSYEENRTVYRPQSYLYSNASLRLEQNIDFLGGTLFLDSDLKYYHSYGSYSNSQFTSVPIRLGYSQNLVGYNSFKWTKRIEPLRYTIAEKTFLYEMEKVALEVIDRYFQVALLKEQEQQFCTEMKVCDTLLAKARVRYSLGKIKETELTKIQLEKGMAQNKYFRVVKELQEATSRLYLYVGCKKETVENISIEFMLPNIDIPVNTAICMAKENWVEYLTAQKQILQGQQELEFAKKQLRFVSSVNASVGLNQISKDIKEAYRNPFQEKMVNISIQIPIVDNGKLRYKYRQTAENLEISMINQRKKEEDLFVKLTSYIENLSIQQKIVKTMAENYKYSEDVYDETLELYSLGRNNMEDVSRAAEKRHAVMAEYYDAIKDYWINYYTIRSITLYDFVNKKYIV